MYGRDEEGDSEKKGRGEGKGGRISGIAHCEHVLCFGLQAVVQKSNYNSFGHTLSLSTLPWKKRKSADPAKSALEESMSL